MVEALFKGLINFFTIIVNIMLAPVNLLISSVFPNFNDMISAFESGVDTYIVPFINYGFHLLPPNAMNMLIFYLSLIIIFYVTTLAIHFIIKVIEIIKNVKIW